MKQTIINAGLLIDRDTTLLATSRIDEKFQYLLTQKTYTQRHIYHADHYFFDLLLRYHYGLSDETELYTLGTPEGLPFLSTIIINPQTIHIKKNDARIIDSRCLHKIDNQSYDIPITNIFWSIVLR